jgi:hypothetical protein
LCCLALQSALAAESNLVLTVGSETYSNVTFGTVTPYAVSIRHSAGIASIPLAKLPPELQHRFGYDPEKAKTQRVMDAQQSQLAEHAEQVRAAQVKARIAKEQELRMKTCKDPKEAIALVVKRLRNGKVLVVIKVVGETATAMGSRFNPGIFDGISGAVGTEITCRVATTHERVRLTTIDENGVKKKHSVLLWTFCEEWRPPKPLLTKGEGRDEIKKWTVWDTE